MKHLLYLPVLFLFSCVGNSQTEPTANEPETKKAYPVDVISPEESARNANLLIAAVQKARTQPVDNTIIFGYEIGMKEAACDDHTLQLVKKGKLRKSGNAPYEGEYLFDLGDGTTTPIDVHASASGVFEHFPRIVFSTPETDNIDEVTALRNRFIEWAIGKYGETFYVTLNHTFPDGSEVNKETNNYTWIVGSYNVDIVIGMKRISVTYSLNN